MRFTLLLASLALGACATALPSDQLASSEAAIRSASEMGALDVPQAALHVRLAEDEMNRAKAFADEGQAVRAALFLERSQADADLAVALVHEANARAAAERVQVDVQNLERSTR